MTDFEKAQDLLTERGQYIAKDVMDTYPGLVAEFDVYVEDGIIAEWPSQVFGIIDMGDVGQWAFQLVENDRYNDLDWIDVSSSFDPSDIKQRILDKRRGNHDPNTTSSV